MNNNSFMYGEVEFTTGDKVTCRIDNKIVTDAAIYVGDDKFKFVCQDVIKGFPATDQLGYHYSWAFKTSGYNNDEVIGAREHGVYNLKLAEKDELVSSISNVIGGSNG